MDFLHKDEVGPKGMNHDCRLRKFCPLSCAKTLWAHVGQCPALTETTVGSSGGIR